MCSFFALAAVIIASCSRPPLMISRNEKSIVIDMQTLGEYPSNVKRIRLTDMGKNEVVWEINGRDDLQIGKIALLRGENSIHVKDVSHGTYDVIAPVEHDTFQLLSGMRYRIEVWGNNLSQNAGRVLEFTGP
jgi:hypothetical protein